MQHLGNIDADLKNADWIKTLEDLRASGVDVERFMRENPDLPVMRRAKANKSFGEPNNTQQRDDHGRFTAGSGSHPSEARVWANQPEWGTEALPHDVRITPQQASQHDAQTLYAAEAHARAVAGTGIDLKVDDKYGNSTQAQQMADALWAKYGNGNPQDAPVISLPQTSMGAQDAIASGILGETEPRLSGGMRYSSGRTMMITLYPAGGQNQSTLYHEMAHAVAMTTSNNYDHGATMRGVYQDILNGEGMTKFAEVVTATAPASSAWTKGEKQPRATISIDGKVVVTCY